MRSSVWMAAALALATTFACASSGRQDAPAPASRPAGPGVGDRIGGWFSARGLDLAEIASVRVGVGPGLLANARITRFVAVGAGRLGPAITNLFGFWVPCWQFGSCRREIGLWTERRVELGLSTLYSIDVDAVPLAGNRRTFGMEARGTFDVGAELYLALVGLAAEVRPDEALDFVAGIFGFDPAGDDPPPGAR